MQTLFENLAASEYLCGLTSDQFAAKAAHFLAELNAIHPFREGNGRTQLTFLTMLAEWAGHPLKMKHFDAKAIFDATVESFGGSEAKLVAVIGKLVSKT